MRNLKLKERAKQLKIDIPAVFIALKHKDTPVLAKLLAAVTICYALSPIDLIPDFIPVLGYLDDVIVLPGFIALTIRMIPAEVFSECRRQAETLWANGKPKMWYYALPVIALWALILYFVVKAIWF